MKNNALPMPTDEEFDELMGVDTPTPSDSIIEEPKKQPLTEQKAVDSSLPMPTDEELHELSKGDDSSIVGDVGNWLAETAEGLGAGAGQGATFNFGEELLAKLASGGNQEEYNRIVKNLREKYKDIKEKAPIATTIGELGGGFLLPGGAVAKAGSAGAGLLGRIVAGGLTGAATSTLAGIGASERPISEIESMAPELKEEAKLGAMLGAGIPLVGEKIGKPLAKELKEYADSSPMIRRWIEAFKLESGKRTGEPINLTETALKEGGRKAGSQKVLDRIDEITSPIIEPIIEIKDNLAKEIQKILESNVDAIDGLKKQPEFINLIDKITLGGAAKPKLLKEFEEILFEMRPVADPNTGKITNKMFKRNNISVADLNEALNIAKNLGKDELRNLGLTQQQINYFLGSGDSKDSVKNILNKLLENNADNLVKAKKQFFETSRLGELILNEIKSDPNAITKNITDYSNEELRTLLQKMLVNKIKTAGSTSTAGDVAMKDLYDIIDSLKGYNKLIKKGSKKSIKSPFDVANLEKEIKQRAEGYGALVGSKGVDATDDIPTSAIANAYKDMGAVGGLVLSSGLQVAGKLGRATTKQPVKAMIGGSKYTGEQIRKAADNLIKTGTPGAKQLGQVLHSAMDNKMSAASVAGLNSLIQSNQDAREALSDLDFEMQNDNSEFLPE
jgi:hypothetical protein